MTYLNKRQILKLHDELLKKDGGEVGILNDHALDYIVQAPAMIVFGKEAYPSIEEKAAVLCYLLVNKHVFNDGNKRIGALCLLTFLLINDYAVKSSVKEMIEVILSLASKKMTQNELKIWLQRNIFKIREKE